MLIRKIFARRLARATVIAFMIWSAALPAHADDLFVTECSLATTQERSVDVDQMTDAIDEDLADELFPAGEGPTRISRICAFDVIVPDGYTDSEGEARVTFHAIRSAYRPYIMFWDEETGAWSRAVSEMDRTKKTVTGDLSSRTGYAAVFVDSRDLYEGVASWYRHSRYPNGAATNLFPIGTKLRVTNLETGAHTQVRVTSTWTQKNPKRVIDLVSTVFKKIGNLKKGLLRVRIEKI